jgi:FKBP-type peptidyl-prolyl cis-trans isomerase FkpA
LRAKAPDNFAGKHRAADCRLDCNSSIHRNICPMISFVPLRFSAPLLCLCIVTAAAAATPADMLPSGVKVVHTTDGTGEQPKASDAVKVHYRGTLADGKEFDSSYKRGMPVTFPLNRVVPCWTEGLQKIKVGGKATLTCPPSTAYGERGAGGVVPPNATLTFEIELLGIEK